MKLSTLPEWLAKIATIHGVEIELGLDRVKKVAEKLDVLTFSCPIILVAGTNGKGSTVAGLEAIYLKARYRVGTFTSPFLFKHNEEVRINGIEASDEAFCAAFEAIEFARGDISLTPFEFHTLAALMIFKQHPWDVLILEVGLGGRLDAVNIMDADVAIVTSIGIDHTEFLGHTRAAIAKEKAGIFRPAKPAVCGDFDPPQTLMETAQTLGTELVCQNQDFFFEELTETWSWRYQDIRYDSLPRNSLATQNMSSVLMAITLLQSRLPVMEEEIKQGLLEIRLIGRIQIIEGPVTTIFDVSHNPDSVALLAKRLQAMPISGKTYAIFSMLADKDILSSIQTMKELIDHWYVGPLAIKRGMTREGLKRIFTEAKITETTFTATLQEAYFLAKNTAKNGDRMVIFGSFHTVAEIMELDHFKRY